MTVDVRWNENLNLSHVNGAAVKTGAGSASGAQRVVTAADGASFLNIVAGQATTVVKASAGTLYAIVLNSAATATNVTTVYDHASGSGTVIAIPDVVGVDQPTTIHFGPTGLAFANGCTVITGTANGGNMTFVYK